MREFKIIFPEEPTEDIILVDRLGDEWHKDPEGWSTLNGVAVGYLWEEIVEARGPLKEKLKPVTPGDFIRAIEGCDAFSSDDYFKSHRTATWERVKELIERIKNDG